MGVDDPTGEAGTSPTAAVADIFISYRHDETAAWAIALRGELKRRYGADHVFMDVADIDPGEHWKQVIRDRLTRCDVVIALIGAEWAEIMAGRSRRRLLDHNEDVVRFELETALERGSRVRVIPVLLDGALMPGWAALGDSLERLAALNAAALQPDRWDADIARLCAVIESESIVEPEPGDDGGPTVSLPPVSPDRDTATPLSHLEEIAQLIGDENLVIPFLGSGVNRGERPERWTDGCGSLPDGEELAAYLADKFGAQSVHDDLAEVSQYALVTKGPKDLYRALRTILARNSAPGPVHRFFAALPATLEKLGHPHRYQLIITANYDDALEQAFKEANEPYDLAVYVAHDNPNGRFWHVPYSGTPVPVVDPSGYSGFPIMGDGEDHPLSRTVILKISGAVDYAQGAHPWKDNYVITENDYIDYLSRGPISSIVPMQLLSKMLDSHLLFLGHRLRDWNLRVFLQRVWGERGLWEQHSWAVGDQADSLERGFWKALGVQELYEVPLGTYLDELRDQLTLVHPVPTVR